MNTVVGFLSRNHGLNALTALVNSNSYKLIKVYTHSLNPSSQDPNRSIRSDYHLFVKICSENNIPLTTIDSKQEIIENVPDCDFIVEISWRYFIPKEVIKKANIGSFGIHRGKLPEYAGAEPIKKALLNNEKEIILSAHSLDANIDEGNVITSISHSVNYDVKNTLEQNIQRLRDEITFLFSDLMFKTFRILETKYSSS
ncbi:MAG: methionyl-tRNA formyltransferase [Thaumarchaeota archaeon]|nr:methionyl-tRNA formyltransferase [Nitrososphaerota archaeon]